MVDLVKRFAAPSLAVLVFAGSATLASSATVQFSLDVVTPGQASSRTDVVLEDVTGGVTFSYTVNDPVNTADITAVYFNLGNGFSYSDLTFSGSAVTKTGGTQRNIQGGNIGQYFDVGAAIGTAVGTLAPELFKSFVFSVFATDLDVSDFLGQTFAVRGVNVGAFPDGGFLTSKNYGTAPDQVAPEQLAPVPLPAAGWMLIAGVGGLGAMSRRRRKREA